MPPSEDALDAALRDALARADTAALIPLYTRAATLHPAHAASFLTHAYVHALELGSEKAAPLRARLVALGAEV